MRTAVASLDMTIDRLGPLDRIMLWASRRWPQDVGAIALLDGAVLFDETGRFRIEAVREALRRRVLLVRRFRQVIATPRRGLGPPLWVDAPAFNIADHVRERRLETPVGEAELLLAVEELRRQPLDPSRPLWEMWFLTGLPEGRVAWFVRIHHTIADGMAAMATLAAMLDPVADAAAPEPPSWQPAPPPAGVALLMDNVVRHLSGAVGTLSPLARPRATVRSLRAVWPAIRELLAEEPATATSLDRMVGPSRTMALLRADLATVKAIGRAHGATVNDVLLAVTAAGLRAVLLHRGERVDGTTVRTYVPVSLRRRLKGVQQGNLIAQMAVPLDMGEADPGRRLDAIALETTRRKERARTSLGTLMRGGGIARRLMLMAVMRQRVNVTTASIPGPKVPLYLAGAPVLEVFPVLPLIANEPLGVGALSYAGRLAIGITADSDAYPDLDVLVAAARDELRTLADRAGVAIAIPASHRDLVECPPVAALTTVMADGHPQTSVVWCDFDGEYVRVNTMRGFAKERNMRHNPRVTLLCYDPRQPLRSLEIRGRVVEMTEDGAGPHLDGLASKYEGRPVRYFGDVIPAGFAETETPVLCRIRPTHAVALDATSASR